ncbi:hypothetical protein AAFC00_003415 [Neodothiora populina]|uniref:Indoleamine 2,3-dioxygenase n=1 Tax=Neodothiora populina TaxID=2781224 RepID=A0ABR3PEC6_9PEZI
MSPSALEPQATFPFSTHESTKPLSSIPFQPVPDLEPYGISVKHGFLSSDAPLRSLESPYYEPWERIARNLPTLIRSRRLRLEIDGLPVLHTNHLRTRAEWQRACAVLGYFTHSYIWAGDRPSERLPPSITVPFLKVAAHLELKPCAPYAVTNLFNWNTIDPSVDVSLPEDLMTNLSYTGSSDESWFYLISVAMEARGARVFPDLLGAMRAALTDDEQSVSEALIALAECIDDLSLLLGRMYEKCDPHVFYHVIRPFLAGSKNMAAAGLPHGVFYDEGNGKGVWRQYSGGSNAQSSLIQFFDAFLGVKHFASGDGPEKTAKAQAFITDMRSYMPGGHRRFIEAVESSSNIRSYCLSRPKDHAVRKAYGMAVSALAALRGVTFSL